MLHNVFPGSSFVILGRPIFNVCRKTNNHLISFWSDVPFQDWLFSQAITTFNRHCRHVYNGFCDAQQRIKFVFIDLWKRPLPLAISPKIHLSYFSLFVKLCCELITSFRDVNKNKRNGGISTRINRPNLK